MIVEFFKNSDQNSSKIPGSSAFLIEFLMTILLLTNMNYSLSENADDRGILQEFRSEKQSTYPTIFRTFKKINILLRILKNRI